MELTAEITSLSRIYCVLFGAAAKAFFKRCTGQTGQEPEKHIHTQSKSIKAQTVCLTFNPI